MARITPPVAGEYLSGLEDDVPYRASIASMEWQTSEYKGKQQKQLVIDWAIDGDPTTDGHLTVRDWLGMTVGTKPNGQPSNLRQVLNALGQQPKSREVSWFDDETLEWSYDGDKPYAALTIGLPVIIRGETVEKQTENGLKRRFVITGYRPAGIAQHPADNPKAKQRPAVVSNDEDDIPF